MAVASYWTLAIAGPTADLPSVALKASDAVGTALVAGLSSVSERVGLGRPQDSPGSTPAAPVEPPASAAPGVTTTRKPDKTAQLPRLQLFELGPSDRSEIETDLSSSVSETAPSAPRASPAEALDGAIYTREDAEVVEPVGLRPQLPRALPPNISRDKISQIELLILPDGTVASVKLLGAPRNVHESMLLSAAKAWQFQPALKHGRPVAYRKRVWLVLQ